MKHRFEMNQGQQAKDKAQEISKQNNTRVYVIAGTDKDRNETFIEIVDYPVNSTIITGFTLAQFKNGKRVIID